LEEEIKNDGQAKISKTTEAAFAGVDEGMELDEADRGELMKFETVQTKETAEIEFDKIKITDLGVKNEYRRIPVPRHRYTPLKQNWESVLKTLVEHMKLQVRMNTKRRAVELRVITNNFNLLNRPLRLLKTWEPSRRVQIS
jgi:RNA-binding protein PNO1